MAALRLALLAEPGDERVGERQVVGGQPGGVHRGERVVGKDVRVGEDHQPPGVPGHADRRDAGADPLAASESTPAGEPGEREVEPRPRAVDDDRRGAVGRDAVASAKNFVDRVAAGEEVQPAEFGVGHQERPLGVAEPGALRRGDDFAAGGPRRRTAGQVAGPVGRRVGRQEHRAAPREHAADQVLPLRVPRRRVEDDGDVVALDAIGVGRPDAAKLQQPREHFRAVAGQILRARRGREGQQRERGEESGVEHGCRRTRGG